MSYQRLIGVGIAAQLCYIFCIHTIPLALVAVLSFDNMKFSASSAAVAAFAVNAAAQTVSGAAEGFAAGVTGGGSAAAVTPTTNEELVSYLGDSNPRTIVLTKTFDFTGSTVSGSGCAPWGTGAGCQTGRLSFDVSGLRTCTDFNSY
jgi:hypothetical protein